MRDPCFNVQCGSFTQRFSSRSVRHLWNNELLPTMMVMRHSIFITLWLCTSRPSVNWAELEAVGDTPGGRCYHSMTVLADGTAVLFGGYNGSGFKLDDLYTLSVTGTTASWALLDSEGDTPGARLWHSMTVLAHGTAVLFGGFDMSSSLNDLYTLSVTGTTASWASLTSEGGTPSARSGHSMTALADGTAVLFGGYYYDPSSINYLDDVYTLSVTGTTASWASLDGEGDTPSARRGHSMTALADGTVVLFGGCYSDSSTNYLDDVYTLSEPTPPPTPSPTPSPTASPTASPTPSDEVSVTGQQHPFFCFLLLELALVAS